MSTCLSLITVQWQTAQPQPTPAKSHTQPSLECLYSSYLSTQAPTHTDIDARRCARIRNGLIVIQAIVVPFSHASQTTVKTHSNRLRLRHMIAQ